MKDPVLISFLLPKSVAETMHEHVPGIPDDAIALMQPIPLDQIKEKKTWVIAGTSVQHGFYNALNKDPSFYDGDEEH